MGIIMTTKQKEALKQGAQWSYSKVSEYVKQKWSQEVTTVKGKRELIFDVMSFIEGFEHGLFYEVIKEAIKKNNIGEDEEFYFEEGVIRHNRYMKLCIKMHNNLPMLASDIQSYCEGKSQGIPNKYYQNFNEYLSKII